MRSSILLCPLIFFSAVSATFQPVEVLQHDISSLLHAKRATTSFNLSPTNKEGNTATTISLTSGTPSSTSGSGSVTVSGTPSKSKGSSSSSATITSKPGASSSNGTSSATSSKTFNAELPAGGVQMLTPNTVTDPAQYYRINEYVTFAWNYTSLKATPSAVNVLVSCAANSATYTIAKNLHVAGNNTQAVTWDTGEVQATATAPLLTETYTLIIYDSSSAITAIPQAGYLATYSLFTFGMYVPEPFQPIAKYVCATCNGASSLYSASTLPFVLGTATLTVLSFGWFGGIAGLW